MSWLALFALLAVSPHTLTIGVLADPVSLDPHQATDFVSEAIVANVCETLVRYRPGASHPEPGLATTWATADGRVWTLTLREGVRFQDGTPFDAEAVVANLEDLSRVRGFKGHAERLGPHVVAITLERANTALLATLSQPFFSLQSPARLSSGVPVGTGPFRFVSGEKGAIELRGNADYWGGPPRLEGVLFKRLANQEALRSAMESGEVDVTSALDQAGIRSVRERTSIAVESSTGLNLAVLSLNNERAPFTDRRVRQAIARAVDRDALVEQVLGGHGEPARNPLPSSMWAYGERTKALTLDRAVARRLLEEAGFPSGFEANLLEVDSPRPYLPSPLVAAERIAEELGAVGIRARRLRAKNWAEYAARGSRGDYDMAIYGWQADSTDPNDFLSVLLGEESIGATNRSRYRSPDMEALLKRGRIAKDAEERRSIYLEAQELFQRDMPFVPLFGVSVFTTHRRNVRDLDVSATGLLRLQRCWKAE